MRYIDSIGIHYSDSPDVSMATIREWHQNIGYLMEGYHKGIRLSGIVERGRPDAMIGAHCLRYNSTSLGVVVMGSDGMPWYPHNSQMLSLRYVLLDWMKTYDISPSGIFLHRERYPTACPGRLTRAQVLALLDVPAMPERVPEIIEEEGPMIGITYQGRGHQQRHEAGGFFSGGNDLGEGTMLFDAWRKKGGYARDTVVHLWLIPEDIHQKSVEVEIELDDNRQKSVIINTDSIVGAFRWMAYGQSKDKTESHDFNCSAQQVYLS